MSEDTTRTDAASAITGGSKEFPLRQFLGMELLDGDAEGIALARIEIAEQHLNPNGVVHGAVLFALVDTAMGKSTMSVLDGDCYCASVEVQLRFIRPASAGVLVAQTSVVKRGRHLVHLDGRVTAEDGRLVATAAGTFAVIRP